MNNFRNALNKWKAFWIWPPSLQNEETRDQPFTIYELHTMVNRRCNNAVSKLIAIKVSDSELCPYQSVSTAVQSDKKILFQPEILQLWWLVYRSYKGLELFVYRKYLETPQLWWLYCCTTFDPLHGMHEMSGELSPLGHDLPGFLAFFSSLSRLS